jgi:hypothetical protein
MFTRRYRMVGAGAGVGLVLLGLGLFFYSAVNSQHASGAQASGSAGNEDLALQAASAELALAEADLQYVLDTNKRVERTFSALVVAEARLQVDNARQKTELLAAHDPQAFRRTCERQAENEVKLAQLRLEELRKALGAESDTLVASQVKRAERALQLARVCLKRVQQASFGQSPEEQLQWQILLFQRDFFRLRLGLDEND